MLQKGKNVTPSGDQDGHFNNLPYFVFVFLGKIAFNANSIDKKWHLKHRSCRSMFSK